MVAGKLLRGKIVFRLLAGIGCALILGACAVQAAEVEPATKVPPESVQPTLTPEPAPTDTDVVDGDALQIVVLYDNVAYDQELAMEWGYSALITYKDAQVLFDTGGSMSALRQNMMQLGIEPDDFQTIVLSHVHDDHVLGLNYVLSGGSHPELYVPLSFPTHFRELHDGMADFVDVASGQEIVPGIYTTGEMTAPGLPGLTEQALVIPTQSGLVVITGCAHPGIVAIVEQAQALFPGEPVRLVMGGMHLVEMEGAEVEEIIAELRALGVEQVAPSHCTGERAIALFAEAFGADFIPSGVGAVIELAE